MSFILSIIRNKLNKYWLVPSFLLLVEYGILTYSITKHQSLEETNTFITKNAIPSVVYCSNVIPQAIRYHLKINQLSKEILEEALQNPKTVERIKELFREDIQNRHSEINGIATLVKDGEHSYYINFYTIPTRNYKLAELLIRERGNKKNLVRIIKENEYYFKSVLADFGGTDETIYNMGMKIIERGEEVSNVVLSHFVDFFIEASDYRADKDIESSIKFYYKTQIQGKYIADFHAHIDGSPPSELDLHSSKFMREIVLSNKKEGFDLYDLIKGESTKIVYRDGRIVAD